MMRTRVWWLIGLMVALLGSGSAQSLVLTNGDVNSDNQVDDADLVGRLGWQCAAGEGAAQACGQGERCDCADF